VSDEALEALLRDAGVEDADTFPIGATIRPRTAAFSTGDTLARVQEPSARPLPLVSVDLGGSVRSAGAPSASSKRADLEVVRVLGEGGMGRVFLVRQHSLEREVAVKTGKDSTTSDEQSAILREGVITGRLEHPSIVPVHALGVDAVGRPVMVMKRIEGVAWDVLLRDPAHPGWEGWGGDASSRLDGHLEILSAICNAVHFAHSRGVVHRDIKPENVLIGRFGDVYLADWGVAAALGESDPRLCGTPGYMAPEMTANGVVDARTDVYLLGATLHEIVTGQPRHAAPTIFAAIVAAKLSEPHRYDAGVPSELAALANAACNVDPSARPQTAKSFREAIADYLAHRESVALGREASERIAHIEALLSIEAPSDAEQRELERLLAEARFGLTQALEQWSANSDARDALARVETIVEDRRRRTAELERQAHDLDPFVSAGARRLASVSLGITGAALSLTSIFVTHEPTALELMAYPSMLLAGTLAVAVAFRRTMLTTAFNRHAVAFVVVGLGEMVLARAVGFVTDLDPATHFSRDAFVWAALFVMAAFMYLRWAAILALVMAATGVLTMLRPEDAFPLFALGSGLAFLLGAALAWRSWR
jgi:serine/threonine-protein kinase